MRPFLSFCLALITFHLCAQGDNEIQVYASPCIGKKNTIIELHSNYTFRGSRKLTDASQARWTNETLEITYGVLENFEIGFYTFTGISPDGKYEYLGNQIRPRFTIPEKPGLPLGLSLSAEFGFFRPGMDSAFVGQGEIRPIVDKTTGNWYFSLNPNVGFVLTGDQNGARFEPQFKTVYTIAQLVGIGIEYYSDLGSFAGIQPVREQEHLLGPVVDLFVSPDWEFNAGFMFGLTDSSNQELVKVIIGRRF